MSKKKATTKILIFNSLIKNGYRQNKSKTIFELLISHDSIVPKKKKK